MTHGDNDTQKKEPAVQPISGPAGLDLQPEARVAAARESPRSCTHRRNRDPAVSGLRVWRI